MLLLRLGALCMAHATERAELGLATEVTENPNLGDLRVLSGYVSVFSVAQLPSRITRHDSMSNVTSPIVSRV